jgi:hypothetical protein
MIRNVELHTTSDFVQSHRKQNGYGVMIIFLSLVVFKFQFLLKEDSRFIRRIEGMNNTGWASINHSHNPKSCVNSSCKHLFSMFHPPFRHE